MTKMRRSLLVAMSALLLVAVAVGGTMAWLTAQTDPVTNTFTVGDINITLTETWNADGDDADTENDHWEAKIVPGNSAAKDPKVTVLANSEACWLFLKVEKSSTYDTYVESTIAEGWIELEGVAGVYYREVAASTANQEFQVLKDDTVSFPKTLTKTQIEALKAQDAVAPTITFTAYAVQKANVATAADAWEIVNP